uniref:G_PROTEIN_RECEP_F1_2 domain-containing protein n=1 Tax=Panagrellus redivivus TaxID=6233 RepID=A0A7E4VE72_PANRE
MASINGTGECPYFLCYLYPVLNVNLSCIYHTVAFGHTIAVAIFRYRALRWPVRANRSLNQIRPAVIASIVIWIIVPLMCIPVFMSSEVIEKFNEFGCQLDEMYDLGYLKDDFMLSLTFWVFGIGMKLIPSIVLSILIIALVRSLNRVERRRRALNLLNNTDDSTRPSPGPNRRLVQTQRTTRMLMAIMILCVIVEFPHGLLNLGIGIYGETFAVDVYDHLGEFMEMATLFYSSVSFMLYCAMSNDFKRTFRRLFLSSCKVCQRNDVCEPEQYRMTSL